MLVERSIGFIFHYHCKNEVLHKCCYKASICSKPLKTLLICMHGSAEYQWKNGFPAARMQIIVFFRAGWGWGGCGYEKKNTCLI